MGLTRFGFQIPSFTLPDVPDVELFEKLASIAVTAEEAGFDSLWVMDHLIQIPTMGSPLQPMLEPYALLSGLAARTHTAKLGALVTGVTYRNPAMLAKTVTTLDVISSGRAILGIGAAWFDVEHRAYGYDFPPVRERMDRLEETLQICRAMFTQDAPSFEGRYHRIVDCLNLPRPVSPGGPPILVGGGGERRTLRLVAAYADACNVFGDAATVRHKVGVLRRHCEELGRDPAEVTTTRLGAIVLGESSAEAARKGAVLREARGMGMEKYRAYAVEGDADAVEAQVQELFDAGLDGLVFNMGDVDDLDAVRAAGELLSSRFGPG